MTTITPVTSPHCPSCSAASAEGSVEWHGLRVYKNEVAVLWNDIPLRAPTRGQTVILHKLLVAQGRSIRKTSLGSLGVASVQVSHLRQWLKDNRLPFTIPNSGWRPCYFIAYTGEGDARATAS